MFYLSHALYKSQPRIYSQTKRWLDHLSLFATFEACNKAADSSRVQQHHGSLIIIIIIKVTSCTSCLPQQQRLMHATHTHGAKQSASHRHRRPLNPICTSFVLIQLQLAASSAAFASLSHRQTISLLPRWTRHAHHLNAAPHHYTPILTGYWLWSPYVIGQAIIFLACDFFLSFFFSFFPRLISGILPHIVWP